MKQYNGEKAIISLTSWKARINTVSKTLYSLLTMCPGFHIVLVLSEDEFPKKEAELPENLMLFVNNDLIEILWVYKNYKAFKKVLFTMDKYRDVPVISADDDCIYIKNYAEELYQKWLENKNHVIRYSGNNSSDWYLAVSGPGTLYTFDSFGKYAYPILLRMPNNLINQSLDDNFYNEVIYHCKLKFKGCGGGKFFNTSNDICPLHSNAWWTTPGAKMPPRVERFAKLFI